MIGRNTFSAQAPVLGPEQKSWLSPSSTVYGGQHDTKYVPFELIWQAAFVADEIWGFMREPARRCRRPYLKLGKYRNSYLNSGEAFLVSTCWGPILYQVHEYFVDVHTRYPGKFWSAYLTHPKLW